MKHPTHRVGVYRLLLWAVLLATPCIAHGLREPQQLEAELLITQLDDDDPLRHEPYVTCNAETGECLAVTLLLHQDSWRCREVEITAHIQGVNATADLVQVWGVWCELNLGLVNIELTMCRFPSQRVVWQDNADQEQEYPAWPALINALRFQLFHSTSALPVLLGARCTQVKWWGWQQQVVAYHVYLDRHMINTHTHDQCAHTQTQYDDARSMLESTTPASPSYPNGVPALLSVAAGTIATTVSSNNATVEAVGEGYTGCSNITLASTRQDGLQWPSSCSSVLFTNQV